MNNELTTHAAGRFTLTCTDSKGNFKWSAEERNLVVNTGLQSLCNTGLGGQTVATWYVGLYGSGASNTPAATDTLALHPGWTEITPYIGTRRTAVFGSATAANPSVISNIAFPAAFNINATATVGGAFLCSVASGTAGTLFSAADFSAPGNRVVVSGDILNVVYTMNQAG
jgi:hypothetical protein